MLFVSKTYGASVGASVVPDKRAPAKRMLADAAGGLLLSKSLGLPKAVLTH
jgi:hypothetical protein